MLRVYGLKNCDSCRKARKWLDANGVSHEFVDVRSDGINQSDVLRWANTVGVERLLNKRGTTWRKLDDKLKVNAGGKGAVELMTDHPALIKRPVFDTGDTVLVGFSSETEEALLRL